MAEEAWPLTLIALGTNVSPPGGSDPLSRHSKARTQWANKNLNLVTKTEQAAIALNDEILGSLEHHLENHSLYERLATKIKALQVSENLD
jgi:hypothetical protein